MTWWDRAACRSCDPDLFFPEAGSGQMSSNQLREAKRVCDPCPVQVQCLAWALDHPDFTQIGVWGGTTPTERRRLLKAAEHNRQNDGEETTP